jgi:hypothetical protein
MGPSNATTAPVGTFPLLLTAASSSAFVTPPKNLTSPPPEALFQSKVPSPSTAATVTADTVC